MIYGRTGVAPRVEQEGVEPTGADYLGLVLAAHEDTMREGIAYRDLDLIGTGREDG